MFGDRGEQHDPSEPEEFHRRMLQEWYYTTGGAPPAGGRGWWPLAPQTPKLIPFELYDDIAPAENNKYAYPMLPDLSDADTSADKIQVSDLMLNDVRAYGRNHSGWSSSVHGARGWYFPGVFDGVSAINNPIVVIQRLAKLIKVSISTGTVAGGATFTPTALSVMDDGQDPSGGGLTYPTITNYSSTIGSAGGSTSGIICAWDASIPGYLVIDAACAS